MLPGGRAINLASDGARLPYRMRQVAMLHSICGDVHRHASARAPSAGGFSTAVAHAEHHPYAAQSTRPTRTVWRSSRRSYREFHHILRERARLVGEDVVHLRTARGNAWAVFYLAAALRQALPRPASPHFHRSRLLRLACPRSSLRLVVRASIGVSVASQYMPRSYIIIIACPSLQNSIDTYSEMGNNLRGDQRLRVRNVWWHKERQSARSR